MVEREGSATGARGTLVVFPGALGDTVCLEPAVAWLGRRGPVHLLARGAAGEVARLFPGRPCVGSLDGVEVARLFSPRDGTACEPSGWLTRFESVVSFTGAHHPEVRARLTRLGNGRVLPFPARTGSVHAIDEMLAAVSEGAAAPGAAPALSLDGPLADAGTAPGLVLHPGSGGAAKRAPAGIFRAVAKRWRQAIGAGVLVLLGPAERNEREWWTATVGEVACPHDVRELVRTVSPGRIFLGNDAGPSHVAAALGVPTIVLFTVTSPARFGPRGHRVQHLHVRPGTDGDAGRVWEAVAGALP